MSTSLIVRAFARRPAQVMAVAGWALLSSGAIAGDLGGQHPAVLLQADVTALKQRIDPNTFMPAHPARLALRAGHANGSHPAVMLAAQGTPSVDANAYLVQPPAATQWRLASAVDEVATPAVAAVSLR